MKSIIRIIVTGIVLTVFVGGAYAQFATSEDAIKYRKSVMFLIAQHFKRMGAVVQGKADFDKEKFAANADVVEMLATLPWEASMVPGTDKGDTTMSSSVFSKQADFKKAIEAFESAASGLSAAAKGGDMNEIKPRFGAVAGSCKSCHTAFRTK